ncbi:hypothetical protein J6590_012975 [Homalodisca vitripennis]|nr:hypothetical protein J6590_012975 [Homalodisca vitripennis]
MSFDEFMYQVTSALGRTCKWDEHSVDVLRRIYVPTPSVELGNGTSTVWMSFDEFWYQVTSALGRTCKWDEHSVDVLRRILVPSDQRPQ